MLVAALLAAAPQAIDPPWLVAPPATVLLHLAPQAKSKPVRTAWVAARGIDPDQPWLAETPIVNRDGIDVLPKAQGGGLLKVHVGAKLAVAAMDPSRGIVEEEFTVPTPGNHQPLAFINGTPVLSVPLELPGPGPHGTLRAALPRRLPLTYEAIEIRTPQFGIHWMSMTSGLNQGPLSRDVTLPQAGYLLHTLSSHKSFCGESPVPKDLGAWSGRRVSIAEAELTEVQFVAPRECAPLTIQARVAGPLDGARTVVSPDPDCPLYMATPPWAGEWPGPEEARHLITISITPIESDVSLDRAQMVHKAYEYGPVVRCLIIGETYVTRRSFKAGAYEVTAQGPGIQSATVKINHDPGHPARTIQLRCLPR